MSVDLTLKLSGMKALAYDFVGNGWNVLVEFNEKRPKKFNPSIQGRLGKIAGIASNLAEGRFDKAREIVFFPALNKLTNGYDENTVFDRGSYTVKGFSKFFRQADYNTMFNSPRQARLDGSFEYRNKCSDANNRNPFMVIQKENELKTVKKVEYSIKHWEYGKGTKDDNYKLIADIENSEAPVKVDLESIYPLRYILKNNQWLPQIVFNLDTNYQANSGIPSRIEPKKLGSIVPVVSGERAGVAGTWNPVNASNRHPDKLRYSAKTNKMDWKPGQLVTIPGGFSYKPEHLKSAEEKILEAQLGKIDNDKQAYEASRGYKEKPSEPFNQVRIVKK